MLAAMDDGGGWESVANVRFSGEEQQGDAPGEDSLVSPPPPPEFLPAPPPQFDNAPPTSDQGVETPPPQDPSPPAKQYVYGNSMISPTKEVRGVRVVETRAKRAPPLSSPPQQTFIEAEIRAHQAREDHHLLRGSKGASSPHHDSDEGFVDKDDPATTTTPTTTPSLVPAPPYTHSLPGPDGQPVIYDAVSPPVLLAPPSIPPTTTNATETKIALEIRELKEREEELRRMRERLMASSSSTSTSSSRDTLLAGEEEEEEEEIAGMLEEEEEEEGRDDHLTSLTTTTDEGNFSECGDPASSSEDKSSDGSNSRMMSPEVPSGGSGGEYGRRKVTVKPYQDDDDDQPVYRMQKESVIEREIRLAREREEAFRREKGLTSTAAPARTPAAPRAPVATTPQQDGRDVQHRMATSRIQQEIQETSMKERELRDAGKILTMSEDTVDAKVTRMSDFSEGSVRSESPRPHTPSSVRSPSSPVPNFTPSPSPAPPRPSTNLSRSLSTNNLASTSTSTRATKGLMQKFFATRGKIAGSTFSHSPVVSPSSSFLASSTTTTSRGIPTRPMRVEPKAVVLQRETLARMSAAGEPQQQQQQPQQQPQQQQQQQQQVKQQYRRSYCTAEEKIQSELREMQMREEELKRLRARQLAQSQPNLAGLYPGGPEEGPAGEEDEEEEVDGLQEVNGLRAAHSNPNLLDQPDQVVEKGVRRRSALIAHWETRIQQTTDT